MKAILITLLIFIFQAPGGATIEGRVTRAGTNDPVPGASLVLTRLQGQLSDVQTALADENGHFVIRDVAPGTRRLFAYKNGYMRTEYEARAPGGVGLPIELVSGENRRDLAVSMTPLSVISGKVLDEDGNPVANVFVRASRTTYSQGVPVLSLARRTETNDLGEFRLFDLEPDEYVVMVEPRKSPHVEGDTYVIPSRLPAESLAAQPTRISGAAALDGGQLSAAAFRSESFDAVYYPTPLDVGPGTNISGIDLRIGTAQPTDSKPANAAAPRAPTFSLNGKISIEGRTLAESASDFSGIQILMNFVSLTGGPVLGIRPGPDGTFNLTNASPGDYRLFVLRLAPGFYVKSARLGSADVLSSGLHLDSSPDNSLMMMLSPNGATVDVFVTDGPRPAFGATVVAVPAPNQRTRGDLYVTGITNADGHAHLEGVAPGEFKIFAWEGIRQDAWQNADIIRKYENQGQPVRLNEGSKENVTLRVTPFR